MSKHLAFATILVFVLLVSAGQGTAGEKDTQRLITVSGNAEVRVTPDRAVFALGVETWDKEIEKARQENDERMKNVFRSLAQYQIPAADIQTGYITITPTYEKRYDKRNNPTESVLTGYRVEKMAAITLKDLSRLEKVLSTVYRDGANRVYGVSYRTSDLRKYRDQARSQAIRAAREKAEALTREIGQKAGKACTITEDSPVQRSYGMGSQNVSQNVSDASGRGNLPDSTVSPGSISVSAQVTVSFELE
jgi:uncharacterized protein